MAIYSDIIGAEVTSNSPAYYDSSVSSSPISLSLGDSEDIKKIDAKYIPGGMMYKLEGVTNNNSNIAIAAKSSVNNIGINFSSAPPTQSYVILACERKGTTTMPLIFFPQGELNDFGPNYVSVFNPNAGDATLSANTQLVVYVACF